MALYCIDTHGHLEPHLQQEWLLTNGSGAFASGTVVGCNTRRYHGLLCAATLPPVGRVMVLNRIGEQLSVADGVQREWDLSVNQFAREFHPRGDFHLRRFELDGVARWEYFVEGATVTKEVHLLWMKNGVGVRYRIEPEEQRKVTLRLLPMLSLRDFHGLRREQGSALEVLEDNDELVVRDGETAAHLRIDQGRFERNPQWWSGHTYAVESERGLDDTEDLFCPGQFVIDADGPTTVTLWAWAAQAGAGGRLTGMSAPPDLDWERELSRRPNPREPARAKGIRTDPSTPIQRLLHAAADFVVARTAPDGSDGTTIIAGYPWFADWGRDTFISLPGLLLTSGRWEQARQVLKVFAEYVSEGMIPNRFDDYTNEPSYNTVDASLWFIHAAFEYLRCTKDYHTFEEVLQPACRAIIEGYQHGTRYHIAMDAADELIRQGDARTQLTWMDAKSGDEAFTPRQGKPVEINALWYHALVLMEKKELAAKVRESFQRAFWISPYRGLCDVVEEGRRDMSLRPNQIFAASLPNSPLTDEQQAAVVEVVRRELLTPMGLRSLSRDDPKYRGCYAGSPYERDKAYHNGTVWAWPIGAFLDAYLKVHNRSESAVSQARRWLQPLIDHLEDGCIGQISEIFEGDEPHRPVGCFAQAWSVAEVLRLAVELGM